MPAKNYNSGRFERVLINIAPWERGIINKGIHKMNTDKAKLMADVLLEQTDKYFKSYLESESEYSRGKYDAALQITRAILDTLGDNK